MANYIVEVFAIVVLLSCILYIFLRLRKYRGKHITNRASMTEKEFINEVGILPEHAHWAIKLRDGFAQSMGVSSDAVHPTDTIAYVSSFGFDNHSWGEINIYLSKSLAISIPSKFWVPLVKAKTAKEITIANIIRYFVEHRIELDCE